MNIWDISYGYLGPSALSIAQAELQALIQQQAKPAENKRWHGLGWAQCLRYRELRCELELRGQVIDDLGSGTAQIGVWPECFEAPYLQFQRWADTVSAGQQGRIPLPKNAQELWSHHKYSVLARDQKAYKEIGQGLAQQLLSFEELAEMLVNILRIPPQEGGVQNAVQHMWGYVALSASEHGGAFQTWSLAELLHATQAQAKTKNQQYLWHSTALSELMIWL